MKHYLGSVVRKDKENFSFTFLHESMLLNQEKVRFILAHKPPSTLPLYDKNYYECDPDELAVEGPAL